MSSRNHAYAAAYFNLPKGWVLHHKDVNLKYTDPERYYQWRVEDLVPMTKSDHVKLHLIGKKHKEETIQKMKVAQLGDKNPAKRPEVREKISNTMKGHAPTEGTRGRHWYNNGIVNKVSFECPKGFVEGRL